MPLVRVVAGIVAYNPDAARLRENVEVIGGQVDAVLVVDNNSLTPVDLAGVTLIRNPENRGMSGALNQVMVWARDVGATCAVLLDQDSVADPGMVAALLGQLEPSVGMVAPRYVDRNLGGSDRHDEARDVDHCITSGSLCRISAWESIGGYDEQLFVDFVDFDLCLRLRTAGWRIRLTPDATLLHEIGEAQRHGRAIAYGHSASRSYHLARDMLVYARKHRRSPKRLKVNRRGVLMTCLVLARRALLVARFESAKGPKIRALAAGAARGLTVPLGVADAARLTYRPSS